MKTTSRLTSSGVIIIMVVITTLLAMIISCEALKEGAQPSVARHSKEKNVGEIEKNIKKQVKGGNVKKPVKGENKNSLMGCEEIHLPMCKGHLPYTRTKLPNSLNHTSQLQVYKALERLWPYMDLSCSKNLRVHACATYLPKCNGKHPALGPCKKTCLHAKKKCAESLKELMGLNWADKFECKGLPSNKCIKPVKDVKCRQEHPHCTKNSVFPVCANLTFIWGMLPNMFGQCSEDELNTELQYYNKLIATNCHLNLKFLLCGVYSPFCVRNDVPFTFPCREICDEIRDACEPHYKHLYHGLPWPQKLQCHIYPRSDNPDIDCVMPNEGSTFFGGK